MYYESLYLLHSNNRSQSNTYLKSLKESMYQAYIGYYHFSTFMFQTQL